MQRSNHLDILGPIRRLQQRDGGDQASQQKQQQQQQQQQRQTLIIRQAYNVNLQSVQYLVDFLQAVTHQVTKLQLSGFSLAHPSVGGLDVLCDVFASSTTLTKVYLAGCSFGSVEDASRLIATLRSNRLVTDLTIFGIENLEGAAYGNCISDVLQNTPHLRRLELGPSLTTEVIRAFQPGLRSNRHLKVLDLSHCYLEDDGLNIITDSLVGNTTMEILEVSYNRISSNCLDDITRLVKFTLLKRIYTEANDGLCDGMDAMNNFICALHQNTSLEAFTGFDWDYYPQHEADIVAVYFILARNRILNRANALLALQPRTGLPIGSKSGIWYMAMAKMGRSHNGDDHGAVPTSSPGVSAIFKIFQTRPAILEKQLPRPTFASAIQRHHHESVAKRRRIL